MSMTVRKTLILAALSSAILLPQESFARAINARVSLLSATVEKTVERGGDNFYFSVVSFRNDGLKRNTQVPRAPTHWMSKYINKIKEVTLWSDTLQEGVSLDLELELTEEEFSPWVIDESIGQIKLKIQNTEGSPSIQWSTPEDLKKLGSAQNTWRYTQAYELKGHGGNYHVVMQFVADPYEVAMMKH